MIRFPRMARHAVAVAAIMVLGACTATGQGEKEAWGTVIGAATGGLLGASVGGNGKGRAVGAMLGTFAGAVVGNEVGRSLDRADRTALAQARFRALEHSPSGARSEWRNPDSGNYGYVEPRPAYQDRAGRYCREYTQTIYVGGRPEEGYGTACRMPDGSWKIVG